MALGSRKSLRQDANSEAGTHDASREFEADPASEQDALWLALIRAAIELAEQPRYQVIELDGIKKRLLMSKRLWKLKSAEEYASMDPSEIHPAVLMQMEFLIRNEYADLSG